VRNKAAHLAVGVNTDGKKEVLGIWVEATEGARFWTRVMGELKARGVQDVLVVVCDGLTGLPAAVTTVWPQAIVQTCIVHLTRASLRWVNYKDRKRVAAQLRLIYGAPSEQAPATRSTRGPTATSAGSARRSNGSGTPPGSRSPRSSRSNPRSAR
jgi:putative transposase